jgi:hypothetical protein
MQLDDETGARLRALAAAGRSELEPAAQDRIAQRVASEGPRVLRRARRTRAAIRAGGALCAVAVALLWWNARPAAEPKLVIESQQRRAASERAVTAPAPIASRDGASASSARACASREVPELVPAAVPAGADATARASGQRFELGALGVVVSDARSAFWLDARDPCQLKLRLRDGRVSVHAADLGGGELRVVTPSGDVVVHGTQFAVEHTSGTLTVEVAEGRVALQRAGRDVVPAIAAGQRMRAVAETAPVLEPLLDAERAALLALLAAPASSAVPNVAAATPPSASANAARGRSAESLVHEADALWRAGELEKARARYREAGGMHGPTAEAAWLALARRELSAGRPQQAQAALDSYGQRFGTGDAAHGGLAAEAAGIAFRAALEHKDERATRHAAEILQRKYADTPQADAALRWLEAHAGDSAPAPRGGAGRTR